MVVDPASRICLAVLFHTGIRSPTGRIAFPGVLTLLDKWERGLGAFCFVACLCASLHEYLLAGVSGIFVAPFSNSRTVKLHSHP